MGMIILMALLAGLCSMVVSSIIRDNRDHTNDY